MDISKSCLLVFLLLCFSCTGIYAQVEITGQVKTDDNQPATFANILLLNATDSSFVKGTVPDETGVWELTASPGAWIINARMIGFLPAYSDIIEIEKDHTVISVNDLILRENIYELNGIVVEGEKLLIEKRPDRLVVNVENSISSAGSTVLEILEKSPGVMANRQSNSLSMNGRSGVLIMIDGKVTNISEDAIVQMLDGMSSANVEEIELITSPPAKYDAAGSAGMINIVMNENSGLGTNGNLGLTAGYNRGEILAGNFNINQRKNRFNWVLDYTINRDDNLEYWKYQRELNFQGFNQIVNNNMRRDFTTTVQTLKTGLEYDLNNKTSISLVLTGYYRNWDMKAATTDDYITSPDSAINTALDVTESNKWKNASGSLLLQRQITQKQNISLSFDYLYYQNDNPSTYNIETIFSDNSPLKNEFLTIGKDTPIDFKVLALDYINEVSDDAVVEFGGKTSLSQFENEVISRSTEEGVTEDIDRFSSKALLDENIFAGYVSADWKPNNKWSITGGLRYEYTDTYLTTPQEEGLVDREYGNFFPSFSVNYNIKNESTLNFLYSRRITRPTYNDMAPFTFLMGPNTFFSGKPSLQPASTDVFELGYSIKQLWTNLQYSYAKDEIANYQPIINQDTNEFFFRSENLEYLRTYGIQIGFPIYITGWWEAQNFMSYNFHEFRTTQYKTNPLRNKHIVTFNMAHTFRLPDGFSMELTGNYQSNAIQGVFEAQPVGALNFGVRKELNNSQGVFTLSFNDVFLTSNNSYRMDIPEADSFSYLGTDIGLRNIKLTYTYSFGNKKLDAVNIETGADEERKRVN